MTIKLQIISIVFSFIFGIFFSILTDINYKYLFSKNLVFKIIFTFIYIIDAALVYFLFIKKINSGVVHSYFLLFIVVGFIIGQLKFKKYVNKLKNCLKSVNNRKK